MDLIEELKWRGLIHDVMPGTREQLQKEMTVGYIGFDPTADSLHIGNLVQIMLLVHFQKAGHRPMALIGGATGMVGDPSGKSEERNLLSEASILHNAEAIRSQLENFLDFGDIDNSAQMVNNYEWFRNMGFLEFIRDVGKHITINYMMAKDSVQKRLDSGLSFTEFTYQLVQGYDYYYLYKHYGCKMQMGGSDQWGNIVTGTELIRRKAAGEAYAFTSPLITKADGGKFGKTEEGNVWLDPKRTSPYKFYQFWLNTSDHDAKRYIRIFTLLDREEVENLEIEHEEAPHMRKLQKALAKDIMTRVHSEEDYNTAVEASQILFGKATADALKSLSEGDLLAVFEGVPQGRVSLSELEKGIGIIDFLSEKSGFLNSKGEARRALKENSISINKEKVDDNYEINQEDLINRRYVVLQRGKKNYFLVITE